MCPRVGMCGTQGLSASQASQFSMGHITALLAIADMPQNRETGKKKNNSENSNPFSQNPRGALYTFADML